MALDMGQDQVVSGFLMIVMMMIMIVIMMMIMMMILMMMMMMMMMMLRDRYKHWFLRASKCQIKAKERARLKWDNDNK